MYKFLGVIFVLGVVIYFLFTFKNNKTPQINFNLPTITSNTEEKQDLNISPLVITTGLDTPWSIAFLPNDNILVTERPGRINEINLETGKKEFVIEVNNVKEIGEGGLLGLVVDPAHKDNNYIYVYYTYGENDGETLNRVSRFNYVSGQLTNEKVIVDEIPGASNHNGGRIKFGPDKNLYITTGDAGDPSLSQNTTSLAGKILRVTRDGASVSGNPFNNLVYSYGHRNPQGITWDKNGNLWETEHGRSGLLSGLDELNRIEIGKNYGWKVIEGNEQKEGMVTPIMNSGANDTWAPGGLAYVSDTLFWGGLRGKTLYSTKFENNNVGDLKKHFNDQFGRIREVIVGPDNMLYITTSNNDGRGTPADGDDKIIRINPNSL